MQFEHHKLQSSSRLTVLRPINNFLMHFSYCIFEKYGSPPNVNFFTFNSSIPSPLLLWQKEKNWLVKLWWSGWLLNRSTSSNKVIWIEIQNIFEEHHAEVHRFAFTTIVFSKVHNCLDSEIRWGNTSDYTKKI